MGNALTAGASIYGVSLSPYLVSGSVFFAGAAYASFKPYTQGSLNAVSIEIWEDFFAKNLFKTYEWIMRAKDRTGKVISGSVVHIPQAGATPRVRKNRENYPLTVTRRNDTDVTYALDDFSTDAILITDAELIELSTDKINDVLEDHMNSLNREVARDLLSRWFPTSDSNILRSTGGDTAVYLTGQTGTRKKYLAADLAAAKTNLVKSTKKEQAPRIAVMTEDAYNQIKSDSTVTNKDTADSVGAVWKDGDLIKLHGFDIVRTDVVPRFDNTATPVIKAYDEADEDYSPAADDNDAILCYDPAFVHFAKGSIEFYENKKDAQYQGDVYSARTRCGGRVERSDEAGVCAIVQEA